MPWEKDMNGDPKYKVSIYAKEELPTWNEIYNEFYKEKMFEYDQHDPSHQIMDPYWNIPHRKYIMLTVCNQLNKMIFEDGYKDSLIDMIETEDIFGDVTDIMFLCTCDQLGGGTDGFFRRFVYENNYKSPIYTIPLPTGKTNPFIISSGELRISSNEFDTNIWLFPLIVSRRSNITYAYAPCGFKHNNKDEREDFDMIVDFMMKPFKDYFENGVGWKDENGNVIQSDPMKRSCQGAGYDPAL